MTAPALRPRSASEIVDAAFQLLRAHYGTFVTCSAVAYAPVLLLRLVLESDPGRILGESGAIRGDLLTYTIAGVLVSWLTISLMSAVLQVCASQAYLGEEVDVAAAIRQALPRLPRVLAAAVVKFALMTLFFLMFLFPVLWIVALLFAVTPVIVLEGGGVLAAMRRSAALSRRRKWHILNTLGLAAIIYYVLVLGFSAVGAIIGNLIVATVLSSVVTVLVYPVVAITETLLYYDARIQSEGLDIELMTGALDAAPSAPA